MTNIIAAIVITTNSHWSVVKTEPSYINCNVLGCLADHSEKKTEAETIWRVTEGVWTYEGTTNRTVLKSEKIKCEPARLRVLYSGFDYERTRPNFLWTTNFTFR